VTSTGEPSFFSSKSGGMGAIVTCTHIRRWAEHQPVVSMFRRGKPNLSAELTPRMTGPQRIPRPNIWLAKSTVRCGWIHGSRCCYYAIQRDGPSRWTEKIEFLPELFEQVHVAASAVAKRKALPRKCSGCGRNRGPTLE